jgi:hypothetical protein
MQTYRGIVMTTEWLMRSAALEVLIFLTLPFLFARNRINFIRLFIWTNVEALHYMTGAKKPTRPEPKP